YERQRQNPRQRCPPRNVREGRGQRWLRTNAKDARLKAAATQVNAKDRGYFEMASWGAGADLPDLTSAMIFAAAASLTSQVLSFMRHSAMVRPHPHEHDSEFIRLSASRFWSAVSPLKSTPGSSVAFDAFEMKIWPV